MTRKRPVTGEVTSEARYLSLGPHFCNDQNAPYNCSIRTTIRIFVPGERGSRVKVNYNYNDGFDYALLFKSANVPAYSEAYLEPGGVYMTRDIIEQDENGENLRGWPKVRSKG